VQIVTGDTKVVPSGKGDRSILYFRNWNYKKQSSRGDILQGDKNIVSGNIGDHVVTIMSLKIILHFPQTLSLTVQRLTK
jgi:hydrogenase maturation factor